MCMTMPLFGWTKQCHIIKFTCAFRFAPTESTCLIRVLAYPRRPRASSTGPCRLPSWRTASPNRNGLVADGGHARLARGGGQRISTPSGIVDIAPTILHLIGLAQPKLPADAGAGRVLGETLKNTQGESTSEAIRHSVGTKNFEQELLADRFDGKIYLRSARRLV